jgi:hypothetical protein
MYTKTTEVPTFFQNFEALETAAVYLESGFNTLVNLDGVSDFQRSVAPIVELVVLSFSSKVWGAHSKRTMQGPLFDEMRNAYRQRDTTCLATVKERDLGCFSLSSKVHARDEFALAARQSTNFPNEPVQAKASISAAILEMLDNVSEHSEAGGSNIAAFQSSKDWFEVAIGDAGVGIMSSLRTNPAMQFISNDADAIELAIKDGTSRIHDGDKRGFGFRTLVAGLARLGAQVRIRSGNAALEISSGQHSKLLEQTRLKGTVVSFRIPLRG